MNIAEIKHKSIRGVISNFIRNQFVNLVGIGALGTLGYFLSTEEFGIYNVVLAIIGLLNFFSDIGLAVTLIRSKEEPTVEEMRTTFTVQLFLAVCIFLLTLLLTPFWTRFTSITQEGLWLLYALGFSFILASFRTIPSILLERELRFDKLAIPNMVESLFFYGLAVWFAMNGYGVTSYTIAVIARSIIGVIVIYFLKQWPIGFAYSVTTFKNLANFGVKFQLNDLLARLKDDLMLVFLARILPLSDIGVIGWARRWTLYPYQFIVQNIIAVTFSTYARLQHDTKLLAKAVEKTLYFISLIMFPILAGLSAMAGPITEVIPKYEKWSPATILILFYAIGVAWSSISTPLTNTLNAIGEISKTLKLMVFWTLATWLITPLGIYLWGSVGVAIASAVISSTSFITVILVKRVIPFRFIDQVWRQLLASIIMYMVLVSNHSFVSSSVPNFILGIIGGGLVYTLLTVVFGYSKLIHEIRSLISK